MIFGFVLLLLVGGLSSGSETSQQADSSRMEMFSHAGPFEKSVPWWKSLFGRVDEPLPVVISPEVLLSDYLGSLPHGSIILDAAAEHEVDPLLVLSIMEAESDFRADVTSPVGAVGLMQLMPATGKWMGAKDLFDPIENIFAGTRYLKYLEDRFDGDLDRQLAAYNAGEGNVEKYNGIPPFRETRLYVAKVLSNYDRRVAEFESYRNESPEPTP